MIEKSIDFNKPLSELIPLLLNPTPDIIMNMREFTCFVLTRLYLHEQQLQQIDKTLHSGGIEG